METNVKYGGAALPGISATIVLFDTTISLDGVTLSSAALRAASRGYAFARDWFAAKGIKRFLVRFTNDQTFTLNAYRSDDRGVTWTKIYTASVTASAANSENAYDFLVQGQRDWKLELVNGGTAQTSFTCSMALSTERALAA